MPTHTIAELTDDRVLYRDLQPVDPALPGLRELAPELGLPTGRLPRKREPDYARVVLRLAQIAQHQRGAALGALLVLGDTENDRRLGLELEKISGVPTLTFIGVDAADRPAELCWEGSLAAASRWALIDAFLQAALAHGAVPGPQLVVLADIDKTLLGPRGRSDASIDSARIEAAELTAADLLRHDFDVDKFRAIYRELCLSSYHPFTEDNQDFVVYSALLITTRVLSLDQLRRGMADGALPSFPTLVERSTSAVPASLAATHATILAALREGDPTPFKAFRHQEFGTTVARMNSGELPLCGEIFAAMVRLKAAGALCLAASDKPAEASLPDTTQQAAGLLPLHRTPASIPD